MRKHTPLENLTSFAVGCIIAIPICVAAVGSWQEYRLQQWEQLFTKPQPERHIVEYKTVEVEVPVPVVETVHDTVYIVSGDVKRNTGLTPREIDMLVVTVHYEAGNQDMIGRRLVADTVLNRMHSSLFPNTVEEVLTAPGQYNPEYATRGTTACTEEDREAVYLELVEQLDTSVIYFQRGGFHKCGTPAYQHGAHYFSKVKGV